MHAPRLAARLRHVLAAHSRKPIDAPRLAARLRHVLASLACRELAVLALKILHIMEAPAGQDV